MWRAIGASVAGTSHTAEGGECQDSHEKIIVAGAESPVLLLVCSDGAGSARCGREGARLACRVAMDAAEEEFGEVSDSLWGNEKLRGIARQVHAALAAAAAHAQHPIEDLHCTLLFAAVGAGRAAFLQIGDGAIVVSGGGTYSPVFWPQSGEFAGTTNFITFADFDRYIECCVTDQAITDVVLFTDGIERLVLDFIQRVAHQPFFEQMVDRLIQASSLTRLEFALAQFLDSAAINARTDDDKTLMLATRRKPAPATHETDGPNSDSATDADH